LRSAGISGGFGSETKSVRCVVENSFDPFHGNVVSDDPGFETLESRVFYLIQAMIIEDGMSGW
jgi:hypothetical protein